MICCREACTARLLRSVTRVQIGLVAGRCFSRIASPLLMDVKGNCQNLHALLKLREDKGHNTQ